MGEGGGVCAFARACLSSLPSRARALSLPHAHQPDAAARAVAAATPLATLADRMVLADDPDDGLACLRVRSGRCELMVATGEEKTKRRKKKKTDPPPPRSLLLISHGPCLSLPPPIGDGFMLAAVQALADGGGL